MMEHILSPLANVRTEMKDVIVIETLTDQISSWLVTPIYLKTLSQPAELKQVHFKVTYVKERQKQSKGKKTKSVNKKG